MDTRPRKTDRRVMSLRERLDTYSSYNEDGCLIFTRGGSAKAYPMVWAKGKKMTASRAQWTETYGEPPADLVVRHKCDVRNCIELTHLELGTYAQNTADMYDRRREGCSKITREDANAIREFVVSGATQQQAADRWGLSPQQVSNIMIGKSWNE